jgi:cell division protein FtsQ
MDPRMAARRKTVQESRARRNLSRLLKLLVVAAVVALGFWIVRSPLLSVRDISVRGASQIDAPAVLERNGVRAGVPMVDVDIAKVERALTRSRWVIDASVTRDWPHGIVVDVRERVGLAWIAVESGWANVAVDGVTLRVVDVPPTGMPLVAVPDLSADTIVDDLDVTGLLEFLDALPADVRGAIQITAGADGFEAQIFRYRVRIGSGEEGREKALSLLAVIETAPPEGSVITLIAPRQPAVSQPGSDAPVATDDDAPVDPEGG